VSFLPNCLYSGEDARATITFGGYFEVLACACVRVCNRPHLMLQHNEDLHNLYAPPNIIWVIKSRWIRWVTHVARMGEVRNAYNILVGKPEGKRRLGRPRRRWVGRCGL